LSEGGPPYGEGPSVGEVGSIFLYNNVGEDVAVEGEHVPRLILTRLYDTQHDIGVGPDQLLLKTSEVIFRGADHIGKPQRYTVPFDKRVGLVQRERRPVGMGHHQVSDVYTQLGAVAQIGGDIPLALTEDAKELGDDGDAVIPGEAFADDAALNAVLRFSDYRVHLFATGNISQPAADSASGYQSEKFHPFRLRAFTCLMCCCRRAFLVCPNHVDVKDDERHGQDYRENGDVRQRCLACCQFQGFSRKSFSGFRSPVAVNPSTDDRLEDRDTEHSDTAHERQPERAGAR